MNYAKKQIPLILEHEWFRGLVVAFLTIGVALTLYGIYQYIDSNSRIQNNAAYQREITGVEAEPPSQSDAQMFMAADVEYRRLRIQQASSLMFGGIGLAVMALGWLGYDFARTQRRKRQVMPSQSSAG